MRNGDEYYGVLGDCANQAIMCEERMVLLQAGKGKRDTLFNAQYNDAENKRAIHYNSEKICNGLGVTLAQFFDEQSEPEMLTHEQRECLRIWDSLNRTEKKQAIAYMQGLHERMQD